MVVDWLDGWMVVGWLDGWLIGWMDGWWLMGWRVLMIDWVILRFLFMSCGVLLGVC